MSELSSILLQCLLIAGLAAIFYLVLIRPQQQRMARHRKMLDTLRSGDRIATIGGLVGTIVRTDGDDFLVVEIAPGGEIMVTRKSVDITLGKASVHAVTEVASDGQTAVDRHPSNANSQ